MKNIHFSPVLVARADTPIRECVKRMRDRNIGSLLVVSDDEHESLIGIFTERDLLLKSELIESGSFWKKPVRTVMSYPVQVLMASDFDKAPEIMLKHGFRHLPVAVTGGDGTRFRLTGVISMRDLLRQLWDERESERRERARRRARGRLTVVSLDPYLVRFLSEGLGEKVPDIVQTSLDDLRAGTTRSKVAVIDLDDVHPRTWTKLLRELNRKDNAPFTFLVFNPSLYKRSTIEILGKLRRSNKFASFAKPIQATLFFQHLLEHLTR